MTRRVIAPRWVREEVKAGRGEPSYGRQWHVRERGYWCHVVRWRRAALRYTSHTDLLHAVARRLEARLRGLPPGAHVTMIPVRGALHCVPYDMARQLVVAWEDQHYGVHHSTRNALTGYPDREWPKDDECRARWGVPMFYHDGVVIVPTSNKDRLRLCRLHEQVCDTVRVENRVRTSRSEPGEAALVVCR